MSAFCPSHAVALILQDAAHLLYDVGLTDLLQRIDGDWLRQEGGQADQLVVFFASKAGTALLSNSIRQF